MINMPLTSQMRMFASSPETSPVIIMDTSEVQLIKAAPLCSGTTNPLWGCPLPQPLCESVFPQQIIVIERERAVHSFWKYYFRLSAGSDGKQMHLSSNVKFFFLIPWMKPGYFVFCFFKWKQNYLGDSSL